jgi:hypothetical protein
MLASQPQPAIDDCPRLGRELMAGHIHAIDQSAIPVAPAASA